MECTQNLGQIIWKKYINEFKMLILELLEEGKIKGIEYLHIKKHQPYWWKNKFSVEVMISYRYIKIDEYFRRNI